MTDFVRGVAVIVEKLNNKWREELKKKKQHVCARKKSSRYCIWYAQVVVVVRIGWDLGDLCVDGVCGCVARCGRGRGYQLWGDGCDRRGNLTTRESKETAT